MVSNNNYWLAFFISSFSYLASKRKKLLLNPAALGILKKIRF